MYTSVTMKMSSLSWNLTFEFVTKFVVGTMVIHYKLSMYHGAYQSNLKCQAWGMFLRQLYFHCLCTGS